MYHFLANTRKTGMFTVVYVYMEIYYSTLPVNIWLHHRSHGSGAGSSVVPLEVSIVVRISGRPTGAVIVSVLSHNSCPGHHLRYQCSTLDNISSEYLPSQGSRQSPSSPAPNVVQLLVYTQTAVCCSTSSTQRADDESLVVLQPANR